MSSDNKKTDNKPLRSQQWYGKLDKDGFICNRHFRELAVNSRMISGQSLVVDGGRL
ncbi:hypothetical protein [Marinomonas primoryensis]|jgi:dihydroxy-acid dehydratase|uniref:Uncharacterized protein n=1 Tax=Marinomonas primoryensis TaxID=178399 RepID=A0A859D1Q7_9GAMM|nr:hypothetical protein [Marinomonas primoryensis]QKK80910.1 uncharacterized protein MP3633_2183 [Marinomonas primoryensis]|tara:strand:- start:756 stop:923 length:168 start_codon:yes stop_codon:yes gene_type:complete